LTLPTILLSLMIPLLCFAVACCSCLFAAHAGVPMPAAMLWRQQPMHYLCLFVCPDFPFSTILFSTFRPSPLTAFIH